MMMCFASTRVLLPGSAKEAPAQDQDNVKAMYKRNIHSSNEHTDNKIKRLLPLHERHTRDLSNHAFVTDKILLPPNHSELNIHDKHDITYTEPLAVCLDATKATKATTHGRDTPTRYDSACFKIQRMDAILTKTLPPQHHTLFASAKFLHTHHSELNIREHDGVRSKSVHSDPGEASVARENDAAIVISENPFVRFISEKNKLMDDMLPFDLNNYLNDYLLVVETAAVALPTVRERYDVVATMCFIYDVCWSVTGNATVLNTGLIRASMTVDNMNPSPRPRPKQLVKKQRKRYAFVFLVL